ncbi:MAG: hypothetical protein H7249_12015 [Chitinophagaceae bacterium]|nr:hypothetical protein [Oligoflexus sp.]
MRASFLLPFALLAAPLFAQTPTADTPVPAASALKTPSGATATNAGTTPLPTVGYKDNGGGFYLQSADESIRIGMMGYIQAVQRNYASKAYDKYRTDYPLDFTVKRARVAFMATFEKMYDMYFEFDGAPIPAASGPTAAAPNAPTEVTSAFGVVEAKFVAHLLEDRVRFTIGKFIMPFSAENGRSARAYDTVERYMVENAMFALPAIDSQYGTMLSGKEFDKSFEWYLSVLNGNARTSRNTEDDNGSKEVAARIVYNVSNVSLGLGYDTNQNANAQSLKLTDLTGTLYNSAKITGRRQGWSPDFYWKMGDFSFRTEYMTMMWKDSDVRLFGGFVQMAYFLVGDDKGGFQPLARWEQANLKSSKSLTVKGADELQSLTLGWQWFLNGNVRNQFNFISTRGNEVVVNTAYDKHKTLYSILNEFQIKF